MNPRTPRRAFLRAVGGGAAIALAGCTGSDTDDTDGADATTRSVSEDGDASGAGEDSETSETSGGVDDSTDNETSEASANDSVPARYETAKSLAGRERDPDSLTPKDVVAYQASVKDGHGCSGCAHFIPPKGDDDAGACAVVEGRVKPDAWCKLFSPTG